jgi:Bacterial Ig-like domain (group 2)
MILHRRASILLSTFALPILLSLAGCAALKSIVISPAAGSVVLSAVGQTAQFTALGTSQMGSADPKTSPVSVNWSVSNPSVATIDSTGLAKAVGAGNTQILAESGGITATSDLTVNLATNSGGSGGGSGGTTGPSVVTGLAIIPGSQVISSPSQTTQFLAIGTTSAGATLNLTNQVAWSTSSTQIATIGALSGLATGVGQGTATIAALYTNASAGTVVPGTATFTVSSGATEKYTSVTLTPGAESLSASGQTGQFIALAASGSTGLQTNVTNSPQITWTSSIPSVATVSSTGLVTGVSPGTVTISAVLTNTDGTVVSNTASVTTSITAAPEPLLSLTVIPSSITVGNYQGTGQFLAIATYSTPPYVRDLTNSPNLTWISSFPNAFPVDSNTGGNAGASAGIVTAYGSGSAVIIAEATNPLDGTIQTATATFNCPLVLANPTANPPTPGSCYPGTQGAALLATLTVYNEGLNTTNWEVTAPSATGTANVLHCGPGWALNGGTGGSVCTATYPIGATIILTAPKTGAAFGGWTYNCANQGTVTAAGPNTCTVVLSTNDTVGAIFN